MNSWRVFAGVLLMLFLWQRISIFLRVLNLLRGLRFTGELGQVFARDLTPQKFATVLESAGSELEKLGYRFDHAALRREPRTGEDESLPYWVYYHPETSSYAFVRRTQLKTGGYIPRCVLLSFLEDGRVLETSQSICPADASATQIVNQVWEIPLEMQHESHLERARKEGAARSFSTPEELYCELNRQWQNTMDTKLHQGTMVKLEENTFAYTYREAVRQTYRLLAEFKRMHQSKANLALCKKLDSNSIPSTPKEETEQFLRIRKAGESSPQGVLTKLVLLVISMILLCLGFRLSFSWETVLILLGVLTFHESGHLLGMRLFGYKNLQLLFLPFLGAVAIGGKKEYVAPWKELVVLFLGPLPGVFIGLVVMLTPGLQKIHLLHEVGILLVGLNVFNLFPIHPLDGGQIWDILIFRRTPIARVLFLGGCALLLCIAGLSGAFGRAFLVFGGLLLMQIPSQFRQAKLISSLRKQYGASLSSQSEETILSAIFDFLARQPKPLPLAAKYQFTSGVLHQTKADPAGVGAFLFGIAAYTSPIWMAIFCGVLLGIHSRMAASSELTQAKESGLLKMPVEQIAKGGVDAAPIFAEMNELLQKKDVDLKLSALRRHLGKPGVDTERLRGEFADPDIHAFLQLARKAASADYIDASCPNETRMAVGAQLPPSLVLAAECSVAIQDQKGAWDYLEGAFQCVGLKTSDAPQFGFPDPQYAFSTAMTGMRHIMLHQSPDPQEIARLRELISPRRLGRPILEQKLRSRIASLSFDSTAMASHYAPRNPVLRLIHVLNPPVPFASNTLGEVRELRKRLDRIDSDPGVHADELFGKPNGDLFLGSLEFTLTQINLGRAALAMEEYRSVHSNLPERLSELQGGLNGELQDSISWDKQTLRLKARAPEHSYSHALEAENSDEEEKSYDPYSWKIRADS